MISYFTLANEILLQICVEDKIVLLHDFFACLGGCSDTSRNLVTRENSEQATEHIGI